MEDKSHISCSVLKLINQVKDLESKIEKRNKVVLEDSLAELQKTYKDLVSRAYKEAVDISNLLGPFSDLRDELSSIKKKISKKPLRFMEVWHRN